MAKVANFTNPQALTQEPVLNILREAFPEGGNVAPEGFDAAASDFVRAIQDPNTYLLVGMEKGEFRGVVLMSVPANKIAARPQVIHFFNKGSMKMRDALLEEMTRIIAEEGFATFSAVNASGKSDEAWLKTFKKAGQAERIGSLFKFNID